MVIAERRAPVPTSVRCACVRACVPVCACGADLLDVTQKQAVAQTAQLDADLGFLSSLNKLQRWLERVHDEQVRRARTADTGQISESSPARAHIRTHRSLMHVCVIMARRRTQEKTHTHTQTDTLS